MELHGRLPRWKTLWFVSQPSRFFNKYLRCLRSGCVLRALLLAGHGCEGEEGVVDTAAVWTRLRRSSGSATSTVASKRWRCVAAAIFGQANGPAVLDQIHRAFSSFARGFLASMRPSPSGFWHPKWFVSGGDRNDRICWLGGGVQGLTCVSRVFASLSRVQSVFPKGLCVISGAARALSVNSYPPPGLMQNTCPSGLLPFKKKNSADPSALRCHGDMALERGGALSYRQKGHCYLLLHGKE